MRLHVKATTIAKIRRAFVLVAAIALVAWLLPHRPRSRYVGGAAAPKASASGSEVGPGVAAVLPASVAGVVRGASGEVIAVARVCAAETGLENIGASTPVCVEIDGKGHYSIPGLPPGGYAVTAEAEGFVPGVAAGGQPVFLASGESKSGVDIVLEGGGAELAGLVVDATGGFIAGATIRATRVAPPYRSVAVTSNAEGHFSMWVTPGPVTLIGEAIGYASQRTLRTAPTSHVVLTLTPGSNISGDVVSASDGTPVPDVTVHAVPAGGWASPMHPSGTTSAEGAFAVRGLEPGEYTLVAEGSGWRGGSAAPMTIGLAETLDHVRLYVSPAVLVSGKVVLRSTGEPCRQGSVTLGPTSPWATSPFDPPSGSGETTVSTVPTMVAPIEPNGEVHFRAVTSGAYHVVVQCPDKVFADGPRTLGVRGVNLGDVTWKVDDGLGMVVHVIDDAEHPVPGAPFLLFWPPGAPGSPKMMMPLWGDGEGRCDVPGVLYPGTYTLQPDHGYDGRPVQVELRGGAGKVDATLRLDGSGSIVVAVQTGKGEAVDDVAVTATLVPGPAVSDAAAPAARTQTGVALGGGRFRIGPMSAGAYRIDASDGVNPPATASAEIASGSARETTIVLDRGDAIRGRVVDGANQPLPDTWVSATCREDGAAAVSEARAPSTGKRVVSDAQGRFAVSNLRHGTVCAVRAEQPYGAAALRQGVRPGDDVTIALPDLGILRGFASLSGGRAVDRFSITVQTMQGAELSRTRTEVVVSDKGTWSLQKVLPGQLKITAWDDQGDVAQAQVELASGQALDLPLQFRVLQAKTANP